MLGDPSAQFVRGYPGPVRYVAGLKSLQFRHDCQNLGCSDPACPLCKTCQRRRCEHNFASKYLAPCDVLEAKCGAQIYVVVVDALTGQLSHPDIEDPFLQICIIDGRKFEQEGEREEALDGCVLLMNKQGQPLLQHGRSGTLTEENRVMVPLTLGQAMLPDLKVTDSSEALLMGRAPPFRLLVRLVDRLGVPVAGIKHALSEPFVVATARVKGAAKTEIPHVDDHVSKIECVGVQTQKKLEDIRAASEAAGLPDLRVPVNSVTRVGQFRELVELAEGNKALRETLKQVLRLTKGWDVARDHVLRAVETDDRLRVFHPPDRLDVGLVFKCGPFNVMDLNRPIGLLRRRQNPTQANQEMVDVIWLSQDAATYPDAVRRLLPQAFSAWWRDGHPGWALLPLGLRTHAPRWDDAGRPATGTASFTFTVRNAAAASAGGMRLLPAVAAAAGTAGGAGGAALSTSVAPGPARSGSTPSPPPLGGGQQPLGAAPPPPSRSPGFGAHDYGGPAPVAGPWGAQAAPPAPMPPHDYGAPGGGMGGLPFGAPPAAMAPPAGAYGGAPGYAPGAPGVAYMSPVDYGPLLRQGAPQQLVDESAAALRESQLRRHRAELAERRAKQRAAGGGGALAGGGLGAPEPIANLGGGQPGVSSASSPSHSNANSTGNGPVFFGGLGATGPSVPSSSAYGSAPLSGPLSNPLSGVSDVPGDAAGALSPFEDPSFQSLMAMMAASGGGAAAGGAPNSNSSIEAALQLLPTLAPPLGEDGPGRVRPPLGGGERAPPGILSDDDGGAHAEGAGGTIKRKADTSLEAWMGLGRSLDVDISLPANLSHVSSWLPSLLPSDGSLANLAPAAAAWLSGGSAGEHAGTTLASTLAAAAAQQQQQQQQQQQKEPEPAAGPSAPPAVPGAAPPPAGGAETAQVSLATMGRMQELFQAALRQEIPYSELESFLRANDLLPSDQQKAAAAAAAAAPSSAAGGEGGISDMKSIEAALPQYPHHQGSPAGA